MSSRIDGPGSPLFHPIQLSNLVTASQLTNSANISSEMASSIHDAPTGDCISWGIPFKIEGFIEISNHVIQVPITNLRTRWLIYLHTSDIRPLSINSNGMIQSPMRGEGQLNELAAKYTIIYSDGSEAKQAIRRRIEIGAFERRWGDNCFLAVEDRKPKSIRAAHEQAVQGWGHSQTRVSAWNYGPWVNWLWAWENPHLEKEISALRFEPVSGTIILSGISCGDASQQPFRWQRRLKALLSLPDGEKLKPDLDENGCLEQIQVDMGQIISAQPRLIYPTGGWIETHNLSLPEVSDTDILIEYTAHPDANFYLKNRSPLSVSSFTEDVHEHNNISSIPAACQRVKIRVTDKRSRKIVAVKIHLHGPYGEYLAPIDRHRIINTAWFEDYSAESSHNGIHSSTYINGETIIDLPIGEIFIEISKGFEIKPERLIALVTGETNEINIEIEKVLPWREKGWVTADTHVHFLSPMTALLEGAGEGVNIVNLLASQWGELMTNVGDFDGKNTWGTPETGGDGEYLVRVGTENRQHVLGHISLLGYRGNIIAPMTTGGPDESALGDPVEILLTEWANLCHRNGGLVVLPHFPNPRAENAASMINGEIDAVEMTSWGDHYSGIDPYSLADWYRFLNCGHLVAAVGGTDKMSAETSVGTVRTYARIPNNHPFTYESWKTAVKRAETFVTYGPLIEFFVDGKTMGSTIELPATGGSLDVTYQVASTTIPVTRIELVANGEIVQSTTVKSSDESGSWTVRINKSTWLAILVRGAYPEKTEIIAAHSSPVMVHVAESPLLSAVDAITILDQIAGAMIYLDTIAIRADDAAMKRMRLVLTSSYRNLHNRLHQAGYYHDHEKFFPLEFKNV